MIDSFQAFLQRFTIRTRMLGAVGMVIALLAAIGAAGVVAGSMVLLGSPDFLIDHGVDLAGLPPIAVDGSMLFLASDGRFAGIVRLGEA